MFRILLTILLLGLFSIGASAKEVGTIVEKKYPPYPEVWGYDISGYLAVMDNRSHIIPGFEINYTNELKFLYFRINMKAAHILYVRLSYC